MQAAFNTARIARRPSKAAADSSPAYENTAARHPPLSLVSPIYPLTLVTLLVQGSHMGSRVLASLFAIALGANPFLIGVLISVYSIFPLMLGVYSGRVSDRYGARRPMLAGTLVIGIGLLLAFLWPYLPTLYVSAVLVGIGFVFYNVSNQNLAGGLGGAAERTHNFATVGLGYAAGQLLGPVIAGYAIEYLGYTYGYLIFSALTLAPAALLAFDKRLDIKRPSGAPPPRNTLALLREPKLRRAILVSGFIVTGWDLFAFYVPIYGHSIELSASTIGNILGVFAAATFIVRALLARITRRFGIEEGARGRSFLRGAPVHPLPARRVRACALRAFILHRARARLQPAAHAEPRLQPFSRGALR